VASGVIVINEDGSGNELLVEGNQPAWSADGRRLAYWGRGIEAVNADGTGTAPLVPRPGTGFALEPSWSPDGTRIAYHVQAGAVNDIYVGRVDGSGSVRITSGPASDFAPAWSPDGARIAFARGTPFTGAADMGSTDIYIVNPDGNGLAPVTSNPPGSADGSPSWSPDGRRLAVAHTTGDGGSQIHLIGADGSGRVNISGASRADYSPAWSPDGRRIVFTRDDDLMTMSADGTSPRLVARLESNTGRSADPDWGTSRIDPPPLALALSGARTQHVGRRNSVAVFARCSKRCTVSATASVSAGGRTVKTQGSRTSGGFLRPGRRKKLRLRFTPGGVRVIRRALERGRRLRALIRAEATSAVSTRRARRTIALRP
jgi:TolB protein